MNRLCMVVIIVLMTMTGCAEEPASQADGLKGAWRVDAMYLISANQDTMQIPVNESLLIFTDDYYSISYAFGKKSPPAYSERWHPNDKEKIARYSSLIVNSGSYQINGSYIEARPAFALAPEFVDGQAVFSYKYAGDTLELIWEKSIAFDGLEYPSVGTVTFLRLVRANEVD